MKKIILFLTLSVLFFSCNKKNEIQSIDEENLFTLNYGNFEKELNIFGVDKIGKLTTSVTMKDGFFYIVNGQNQKILSFNSYGDLLSVYYNEDFYSEKYKGLVSKLNSNLWKPIMYPFELDGKIVVDSKKYMYAVGYVPKERIEQDENEKLIYSQVVLRFSSDGTVLDYIGQQGPSGTPFPFIRQIYVTQKNELVVVCNSNNGSCTYWFSADGYLKYKIPVTDKDIPEEVFDANLIGDSEIFTTIENIIPDYSSETLFVKVDYYCSFIDSESKINSGINYLETVIYPLDIKTGTYEKSIIIPPFEESITEDFSKITYKIPYDFLGISKSGWLFFIISTDEGYCVQMLNSKTQNVIKRTLPVKHEEILFSSINLSDEGIISAILAQKEKCKIVWWKTDSLIDSVIK